MGSLAPAAHKQDTRYIDGMYAAASYDKDDEHSSVGVIFVMQHKAAVAALLTTLDEPGCRLTTGRYLDSCLGKEKKLACC